MSSRTIAITVIHGSILEVDSQVIVNAANSHGLMGGGVAGIIRRAAGSEVETEARQRAPIQVGEAVLTSGGRTKFQGIIHAPTMPEPAMRIPLKNIALATEAAITLADRHQIASLAIPGMGTGVGGISPQEAAKIMIDAIRNFSSAFLRSIILVDIDSVMVQAWREQVHYL